jgi:ribosome-associated translation inhibitor RaiA
MTSSKNAPERFASHIAKPAKTRDGRTPMAATTMHVRAPSVRLDESVQAWVRTRTSRQLGKFAGHIERISVRFEDVNGPRGGRGIVCRMKVALSGLPSIIVAQRGRSPRAAFDLALPATERSLRRALGRSDRERLSPDARRAQKTAARGTGADPGLRGARTPRTPQGSLIGRRVGQSRSNLLKAAARPEKTDRTVPVDTAQKRVSASDRKVGLRGTATRNTKLNQRGMTAALEDSATGKPSRKSTRRSQNRAKAAGRLGRRTRRRLTSPQARARRSAARRS